MTLGNRVVVDGVGIDPVTEADVVGMVCAALERGEGGRIVTPNVDILRLARTDRAIRAYLADATLVVADGMPLVWASRLAGRGLPERVPGSNLIWSLSYHLGRAGRSVYLLGGAPERHGGRRAAAVLGAACPGLRVVGHASPPYGFERDPVAVADACAELVESKPDAVFVGLGFPKQERLIDALRPELPGSWFLGCGAAIDFLAGDRRRAPLWMQQVGLEWAWRLAGDPRRLAGRYLGHGIPYAVRLLGAAGLTRCRSLAGSAPARLRQLATGRHRTPPDGRT